MCTLRIMWLPPANSHSELPGSTTKNAFLKKLKSDNPTNIEMILQMYNHVWFKYIVPNMKCHLMSNPLVPSTWTHSLGRSESILQALARVWKSIDLKPSGHDPWRCPRQKMTDWQPACLTVFAHIVDLLTHQLKLLATYNKQETKINTPIRIQQLVCWIATLSKVSSIFCIHLYGN